MKSQILNVLRIILMTGGLCMIFFGMIGVFQICINNVSSDNYITQNVPCYDRYSSVIQGAVCTEKVYPWQDEAIGKSEFILVGVLILIVGILTKEANSNG